jgi:hypothetical protein
VGSYHQAARRASHALTTSDSRVMIMSAFYGLVDLDQRLLTYDCRLGQRHAITTDHLRLRAEQLNLLDTPEVIVLAPAAYTALVTQVCPHAHGPLTGAGGIGYQMARLTGLATDRLILDHAIPAEAEGQTDVLGAHRAAVSSALPPSNTTADHITVLDCALEQIPDAHRHGTPDPDPLRLSLLHPRPVGPHS